jgi:hypothetical protein
VIGSIFGISPSGSLVNTLLKKFASTSAFSLSVDVLYGQYGEGDSKKCEQKSEKILAIRKFKEKNKIWNIRTEIQERKRGGELLLAVLLKLHSVL